MSDLTSTKRQRCTFWNGVAVAHHILPPHIFSASWSSATLSRLSGDLPAVCGHMHLFISAHAHPAWRLITFTQCTDPPLPPAPPQPPHCRLARRLHDAATERRNTPRLDDEASNCELAGDCDEHTHEFKESLRRKEINKRGWGWGGAQWKSSFARSWGWIRPVRMSEVETPQPHASMHSHMQPEAWRTERSRKRRREGSTVDFLCRYSHLQ